jgi:hypothetical protein
MKMSIKTRRAFNKMGVLTGALLFTFFLSASPLRAGELRIVPDDYTYIQDAIGAATSGDIVFVKDTYAEVENITMADGVDLIGDDKTTTTIQGSITGAANTRLVNFKIVDDGTLGPTLYNVPSAADDVRIINNIFVVDTSVHDYSVISLSNVTGEIVNNAVTITSTGTNVAGINISGGEILCMNNNLSIEGTGAVQGLVYVGAAHTIESNVIKTSAGGTAVTGTDAVDIDYNLLLGKVEGDANPLIGNLLGVDPVFTPGDPSLILQETSPGIDAADPTHPLYAKGVTDIGVYDISDSVKDIREIQNEINAASPGDTVFIEPGTYTFDFLPPRARMQSFDYSPTHYIYSYGLMINKNITLKAIDPNPDNTVIELGSRSISIMDPRYYYGYRSYHSVYQQDNGWNTVYDVTIEGITITGAGGGREMTRVWIQDTAGYYTGYGYTPPTGHWAWFSATVAAPIYNFSKKLTLRDCKILAKNYHGHSISVWDPSRYLHTQLIIDNTTHDGIIYRGGYMGHPISMRYIWLY